LTAADDLKLTAIDERFLGAGITALAMVGAISVARANQPSRAQQAPRPAANTTGERTTTAPETPQRSTNPPQSRQRQSGIRGSQFAVRSSP